MDVVGGSSLRPAAASWPRQVVPDRPGRHRAAARLPAGHRWAGSTRQRRHKRLARPDGRHHPALRPVTRVVQQCRRGVKRRRFSSRSPGRGRAPRRRTACSRALHGRRRGCSARRSWPRSREPEGADHARQGTADEPVDPVVMTPRDQGSPGRRPDLGLRGWSEVEVRLLDQQPTPGLHGRGHFSSTAAASPATGAGKHGS